MDLLIMDRDETERMGIEWFVKSNQMPFQNIYHAENLRQATNILKKHQPDVVMLELEMLTKNNTEAFASHLFRYCKNLITVTAEPVFQRAIQAIELKTTSLLVKPFNLKLLKKALTQTTNVVNRTSGDPDSLSDHQDIYKSLYFNLPFTVPEEAYFLLMEPEHPSMNKTLYDWVTQLKLPFRLTCYPLNNRIACLAFPDDMFDLNTIQQEAQKILYLWEEEVQQNINIAIHDERIEENQLQEIFHTTRKALNMRFYKGFKQIFLTSHMPQFESFDPFLTSAEQRVWVESLEKGDIETIKDILYQTFEEPCDCYLDPEIVRIQITSILAQVRRFMKNYNISKIDEMEHAYHRLFQIILNSPILYTIVQEFILFCIKVINHAKIQKQKREFNYYDRTIVYLENNFDKEDICLNDLADYLNLSPNYLSNLLSMKGKTFKQLLNDIRMKHAKKLLLETEEPIQNISSAVGYRDPNYFSRIYKKYTNMSPREFRQMEGG